MNQFRRIVWLARRNFTRGILANFATIILVAFNSLIFFFWYRHLFSPTSMGQEVSDFFEFFLIMLLVINFISLLAVFWFVNRVRHHEIGLLRGIGARRAFVFKMLLIETQFVSLVGFLFSILFAFLLFQFKSETLLQFFSQATFLDLFLAGLASLGSVLIIASLAAFFPSIVICSLEPYSAIRNRE